MSQQARRSFPGTINGHCCSIRLGDYFNSILLLLYYTWTVCTKRGAGASKIADPIAADVPLPVVVTAAAAATTTAILTRTAHSDHEKGHKKSQFSTRSEVVQRTFGLLIRALVKVERVIRIARIREVRLLCLQVIGKLFCWMLMQDVMTPIPVGGRMRSHRRDDRNDFVRVIAEVVNDVTRTINRLNEVTASAGICTAVTEIADAAVVASQVDRVMDKDKLGFDDRLPNSSNGIRASDR